MTQIQKIPVRSRKIRDLTGLEFCWVVIVDGKVIENGPTEGLHPTEESAKASA
jgi:hypothetical protein